MAVAIPALKRNTGSGSWVARKVIPEDVREVLGRREAKRTWPATLSESEAKAAYGEWLRDTEGRIAAARQGRVTLSDEEVRIIAANASRARGRFGSPVIARGLHSPEQVGTARGF